MQKYRKTVFTVALVGVSLFSASLMGQTPINDNKEDNKKKTTRELKKIEVVASPLEQSTEDAISNQDIRRGGSMDAAEAVSKMPAVELVRRSSISHEIILRGQKKDAIGFTVDGHQMWGACPGRMDPAPFHTDFTQINKINLIRGPYNVTSPGNEAGSVDIETNKPTVKPSVKATITYGSYNYVNAAFEGSVGFRWLQILAGYSYRQSQIYKDGKGNLPTTYFEGMQKFKSEFKDAKALAFGIHTAWGKFQITPAEGHRILFNGSYQHANENNKKNQGVLYYDRPMDSTKDNMGQFSARWEADKMGMLKDTYADVYWNKVNHTMDTSNRIKPPMVVVAKGFVETVGAKMGTTVELDSADIALGWDFYQRRWNMHHTMVGDYIPDVRTKNGGLFLEYKQAIGDKTGITLGGRMDIANIKAYKTNPKTAIANDRKFYLFGGNFQVNHYVVPELNLFLGLGHANRLPDAAELFNNMKNLGNPNLKAEHKTEVDVGFEADSKWIASRLNLFYAFVDNYIVVAAPHVNTQAHTGGFEFDFNVYLPADFSILSQMSYTAGKKKLSGKLKDTDMGDLPPFSGMAGLRWDWVKQGLYIQTDVKFAAAQNNTDDDMKIAYPAAGIATKGWATWNFSIGFERKYYAIRLNVDNILNSYYYKHNSYVMANTATAATVRIPEPGVNFKIQVEGKYN